MTSTIQAPEFGWSIPELTDGDLQRFRDLILTETGIHLRENKRPLLVSRLAQRLRQLHLHSFREYFDLVVSDVSGRELVDFINRITTNKTSFFREPHHFEFLKDRVLPEMRARGQNCVRIWSAACSSGEEPYSIAMLLREVAELRHGWNLSILASDIDTEMLSAAAAGVYRMDALDEMAESRRKAHFLRGYGGREGSVMIRPEVRALVNFRRINLIAPSWPVEGNFDAIFCRNVIIYFDQATQRRILERLTRCLAPDGYFFAGHSENLFWMNDVLAPAGITVYRHARGGGK